MRRSWVSFMVLVLGLVLGLGDVSFVAAGHPPRKHAPVFDTSSPDGAMAMNLENAIKLYLAAKGTLAPKDVSPEPSDMPRKRGKHGATVLQRAVVRSLV